MLWEIRFNFMFKTLLYQYRHLSLFYDKSTHVNFEH